MVLATPPAPPLASPIPFGRAQLEKEYVAGSIYWWLPGRQAHRLPWAMDDLAQSFGDDIYDRMLFDPQVCASATVYVGSVLEEGLALQPAIADPEDPQYDKAVQIRDDATIMFDRLAQPLASVLWDMLFSACTKGSKVAEIKWGTVEHPDGPSLDIVAVKPRPRHSVGFVVDDYMNLIGLQAIIPGATGGMSTLAEGSPLIMMQDVKELLPRNKFLILTFRPKDADPRGTSMLRPVYSPWWHKQQILPEYLKYLTQFAGASLLGFTPEGVPNNTLDADGDVDDPTLSPQAQMLTALEQVHNGSCAVFPGGALVKDLQPVGDGGPFTNALARDDQQITKGILTVELATDEGSHQARAAAVVHQDVLDTLVRQGKALVILSFVNDVLRQWVRFNYGNQAAETLVPKATLGQAEEQDLPAMWGSVAQLQNAGYLHWTQLDQLDRRINLPPRDMTAVSPPGAQPMPPTVPPGGPPAVAPGPGTPAAPTPAKPAPPAAAPAKKEAP